MVNVKMGLMWCPALLLTVAALVGCASPDSGTQSVGQLSMNVVWQQPDGSAATQAGAAQANRSDAAAATTPDLPDSVLTVTAFFDSSTLRCCVKVDLSNPLIMQSATDDLLVLDQLPVGPATITLSSFPGSTATAPNGVSTTCVTYPVDVGEPCDTQIALPNYQSDAQPVVVSLGVEVDTTVVMYRVNLPTPTETPQPATATPTPPSTPTWTPTDTPAATLLATQTPTPTTPQTPTPTPTLVPVPTNPTGSGGTLQIMSGSGDFSSVSGGNKALNVSPGATLVGTIQLSALNLGAANDIAPLIYTPSWGDPSSSWQGINGWIPSGQSEQQANVSVVVPTAPGVYHIIFAFEWELSGDQVASATNWVVGHDVWNDGNDIDELSDAQITEAQVYGYTEDQWLFTSGYAHQYVPADALTLNVMTCVVGTGTAASCTEAALDACLPGGGSFDGTVAFDCGGAATITVTSTKTISADTTIDGGSLITISGGSSVGVFSVNTGVNFTVQNLTIANGNSANYGGGIYNNQGTLTVTNSTFSGNSAVGTPGLGGGIFIGFGGTGTVTNSTFSGNSASAFGGGIDNTGTVTVTNSTFSGNSAGADGGGIDNAVTLTVTNSTFSGNTAGTDGGGIRNEALDNNGVDTAAALTVTNSTFSGNSAPSGAGGGIENAFGGPLTVTNSTFSGNSANNGGGIDNRNLSTGIVNLGPLTVTNSTFSGNSASADGGGIFSSFGTVTVTNTILANSPSGGNCAGTISDGGNNIDDGTTCGFAGAGCTTTSGTSFCNTNPLLDPAGLANNGGPTQTIALCTGTGVPSAGCTGASPGINAGDEGVCSTTTGTAPVDNLDQRGYVRPGTGATNCSIGAYEANAVLAPPTVTPTETGIPAPTPTATQAFTPPQTPTVIATDTPTPTGNPTATVAGTATSTPASTATPAATPAGTPPPLFVLGFTALNAVDPVSVVVADVNGDGRADIVTANAESNDVTVLLGNGDGSFAPVPGSPFAVGEGPQSVAVADVNGDGVPDIVTANAGSNDVTVLLGNGDGSFAPAAGSPFAVGPLPWSVAVADVNGDGRSDIVTANVGSNDVTVLLGEAGGGFAPAAGSPFAVGNNPESVAVADVNNDGRPDIVTANYTSSNVTVLLGEAGGGFAPAAGSPFAVGTNPQSVAVADVNDDGRPDIVTPSAVLTGDVLGSVTVLLGQAGGGFAPAAGSPFTLAATAYSVAVADVNGDGWPDIVTANGSNGPAFADKANNNITVLLGSSDGSFAPPAGSPFAVGAFAGSVAVADVNGDGRPDIMTADNFSNDVTVLLGNGDGSFVPTAGSPFAVGEDPLSMAVADVNGDGRPDIVTANQFSQDVTVLLGQAGGGFAPAAGSPFALLGAGAINPSFVAVADFNGDGRPDILTANVGSSNVTVLLGNGGGSFAPAAWSPFALGVVPWHVAVADLNGDGRPDIVIGNDTSNLTVLLGQAGGGFAPAAGSPFALGTSEGTGPTSLAVVDVNGDGRPDILTANSSNDVTVLLGQAGGGFAPAAGSPFALGTSEGTGPTSLAVVDVNGDGIPDIVTANDVFTVGVPGSVTVLLGQAGGGFVPAAGSPFAVAPGPQSVAVADVNGDGRPDIVVAGEGATQVLLQVAP